MSDPYTRAARVLTEASNKGKPKPTQAVQKSQAPAPALQVVGKKHMDPQSMADEEYMAGAQKRINRRLARGAERVSEEVYQRKGFGLKKRRQI